MGHVPEGRDLQISLGEESLADTIFLALLSLAGPRLVGGNSDTLHLWGLALHWGLALPSRCPSKKTTSLGRKKITQSTSILAIVLSAIANGGLPTSAPAGAAAEPVS